MGRRTRPTESALEFVHGVLHHRKSNAQERRAVPLLTDVALFKWSRHHVSRFGRVSVVWIWWLGEVELVSLLICGGRSRVCDSVNAMTPHAAIWDGLRHLGFAQLRSLFFPRYIEAAAGRQKARGYWQMFGRRPSPSRVGREAAGRSGSKPDSVQRSWASGDLAMCCGSWKAP